jgi:hypothetical protein
MTVHRAHTNDSDLPPETVLLGDELARRSDELVFITRDRDGAEVLRDFGLLAFARPGGGNWNRLAMRPLLDRDVVLVRADPYGYQDDWCHRDLKALGDTVRRIGVFQPISFEGRNPPTDLAELVERQRALALSPSALVTEALGCLEDQMPHVARPDPAADWPPLRLARIPTLEYRPNASA